MSTFSAFVLMALLCSLTKAQGRAIDNKVLEVGQRYSMEVGARRLVGSAPPRCDGKCDGCPECEAVLVPLPVPATQTSTLDSKMNDSSAPLEHHEFLQTSYARGDEISAYKPIMWKCKCGSLIFDP